MQTNAGIQRSKAGQQAQTIRIKPRWHMTALHIAYYLIMAAFLIFYMLPFWGTVMTSFKTNSEVMTSTPITPPTRWTLEGYASAMEELCQYFQLKLPLTVKLCLTVYFVWAGTQSFVENTARRSWAFWLLFIVSVTIVPVCTPPSITASCPIPAKDRLSGAAMALYESVPMSALCSHTRQSSPVISTNVGRRAMIAAALTCTVPSSVSRHSARHTHRLPRIIWYTSFPQRAALLTAARFPL